MDNPCYDSKTHKSCSRRCGACQLSCPEWKKYMEKRSEDYENRKKKYEFDTLDYGYKQSTYKRLKNLCCSKRRCD